MNPEELPRPKGPKVEPIDRRGKLIAFKQSVRKETAEDIPVEAPANETPYERLKRLETDPAANLKELQSTLAYFVPHLQLIEIEAMTFIRGRSIGHAFMIVDEAQNMTPHEAKTVITRIGEGSKVVLIGDLDQVDTPYLDGKSNGLIHTHERMKGHAIIANVRLISGVRSALSELAAQLM